MGQVSPRLAKMYTALRTESTLPVIVLLDKAPDATIIANLRNAGAGPIHGQSRLTNAVFTTATQANAARLASVPGVKSVQPDEPTAAL